MSANYHHRNLKAALLTYAREQMEKGQLDALSMRAMAKAVGVSHTAAYRHFASQRELLDAVAVQGFEGILAHCETAVQGAGDNPRVRLKACGLAYVEFSLASPNLLAHMFHAVSTPHASIALREAGKRFFELLLTLIRDGQSQHRFRSDDATQLAHACWAMVHGLSVLLHISPSHAANRGAAAINAEQAIEILLEGLAKA